MAASIVAEIIMAQHFDYIALGAGSGGIASANRAAMRGAKVLIIEDVITTGKSSLECVNLITRPGAKLVGFATIIDRSTKKSLKIKQLLFLVEVTQH